MSENKDTPNYFLDKHEKLQTNNWQEQIDRLVQYGYHRVQNLEKDEYQALMPKFMPQPTEFRGRFNMALLVDPCIPYEKQLRLMGVENDLDDISDFQVVNRETIITPNNPYQIWVQDGTLYKGKSGTQLMRILPSDERGLTLIEGLALIREIPDFRLHAKNYMISLLGSQTKKYGHVLQISHWTYNDNPSMNYKSENYSKGEEECWSHSIDLVNKTGGWPTCGIIDAAKPAS